MFIAFGESIAGLALAGIMVISISIVVRYVYLCAKLARVSVRLRIMAGASGLLLLTMVVFAINRGQLEYNPMIRSSTELIGDYKGNGYSLRLDSDGTFTAVGFSGADTGEWSNVDFNLTLSGLGLSQSRIIVRNGTLCIAPFYAGVDSHHGVLLKKQ